eukprot:1726894-Pleurochrysis_carterae.AAC.4
MTAAAAERDTSLPGDRLVWVIYCRVASTELGCTWTSRACISTCVSTRMQWHPAAASRSRFESRMHGRTRGSTPDECATTCLPVILTGGYCGTCVVYNCIIVHSDDLASPSARRHRQQSVDREFISSGMMRGGAYTE